MQIEPDCQQQKDSSASAEISNVQIVWRVTPNIDFKVTIFFNVKSISRKWYNIDLGLQQRQGSDVLCDLSNGAISNDLESSLTQISREPIVRR